MHNTQRMTSLHDTNNSPRKLSRLSFSIMSTCDNPIEKLTTRTQLHNKMNCNRILIRPFNRNNIRMLR
ncbi:hypothetical protein HanPSC8_Chr07g0291311 [Helianthus annuus]|nr:hypothetical protein HanPSC8_Chr07g0291311 [Helianthus annuus]